MELSIIIPTKDRGGILQKTLEHAYHAIQTHQAEIIVVNDSKTTYVEVDPLFQDKIKVINNSKSGVASARNLGASQAQAELLLFLDDDMLISAGNIQTTLQLHQQYKNCCINLNWIYPPSLTERLTDTKFGRYLIHYGFTSLKGWNRGEHWDQTQLFAANGITSQYLSIEKTVFYTAGAYNENFPHAGFEDYEFAQRLRKAGVTFYIYPLSMVFHNEEDRLLVKAWLQRKKRGGETRQVAVKMGFKHLQIHYSRWKYILLSLLSGINGILHGMLTLIPNKTYLDFLYFRIVNILLAIAIFDGYHKK
ncbi:glycosyltransferase [Rhodocytophaga rosea]|uniref:Glycosyltransferase n=1 Tax=Rhodocytophaga rosea TaxID=2704465 RepID=A0A6C0GR55_9BACT|nr:glycosyltransferase [Rhodocytophaga rosea]QHT70549.1 glycosyltransferase [Rhodocytophaga rosea]